MSGGMIGAGTRTRVTRRYTPRSAVDPTTTSTPASNVRVTSVQSGWLIVGSIIPNFGDYPTTSSTYPARGRECLWRGPRAVSTYLNRSRLIRESIASSGFNAFSARRPEIAELPVRFFIQLLALWLPILLVAHNGASSSLATTLG